MENTCTLCLKKWSSLQSSISRIMKVLTYLGNSGLCWTVFARNRDTAETNSDLQTLIYVLVARPRRCLTLSNPVTWQNWMVAYLGYTLRMKTLFCGWPVMVDDMHTRRRRRISTIISQLQWNMTVAWYCWLLNACMTFLVVFLRYLTNNLTHLFRAPKPVLFRTTDTVRRRHLGHVQQPASQIGRPLLAFATLGSALPAGNRCHFVLLDKD